MATENNQNELETGSVGKLLFKLAAPATVSYTHLDVYKRQKL